jgi:hypothetical protein
MISKSHCKVAYENGIDGEEYEDFFDFSASYEDVEDVEFDEDGNVIGDEMQVTELGELKLPSGRVVGHRAFSRYYKQRYPIEESRPSVLAQQREELLRLGYVLEGHNSNSEAVISRLSDTEVMTNLIKYHKQIRKNAIVDQRASQRAERIAQRREYNSTKDKLRASENHTSAIRDYHGLL